jgi:hypothetical protein
VAKGKAKQSTLNFPKVNEPQQGFSRLGILEAVTKHIVCDDQVSFERLNSDSIENSDERA